MSAQQNEQRKLLAEQQQAAAEESARLVTAASAALLDATPHATGAEPHLNHPVFGELLCDLGHKRLYRGTPSTLWAGTLLWERQRAFRQERASLIASAKAKSHASGWPGSISVVEMAEEAASGPSSSAASSSLGMLIDGQHRLGAAHLLAKRGKLTGALASIIVEVDSPAHPTPDAPLESPTPLSRARPRSRASCLMSPRPEPDLRSTRRWASRP